MENMNTDVQKKYFKEWLKLKNLSEATILSYSESVLEKINEVIISSNDDQVKSLNPNLYAYTDLKSYEKFYTILKSDPNFDIVNRTGQAQANWLKTPLNHYRKFLLERESKVPNFTYDDFNDKEIDKMNIPLNQILYGPPGTGKTYNTVIKAMEIINPNCVEYDEKGNVSNYSDVKKEFDKAKDNHQIEFVTFHQSYSYEEFVEGIKPRIPEWDSETNTEICYIGSNGIFKEICKKATKNLYKLVNNKIQLISFNEVFDIFKEKYPEGTDFENLLNISYDSTNLIYHFGKQDQDRRIDLSKIEQLFNTNKQYRTASDFNKEYGGNVSLKGYYHTFYKELINIKEAIEDEKQISIESNEEYVVNSEAPKYVFIIDEINRGDVSKIFGELITLIEEDKRIGNKYQMKTTLPYSKESFGVPNNLYIIGTMNTADRSIALLDTALRRRFDFEEIMPRPELLGGKVVEGINLQTLLTRINERITNKYDRDHQIGHSYLMGVNTKEQLERAYKNRILPLLNEYFYNESKTVAEILNCSEDELKTGDFISILGKAQGA